MRELHGAAIRPIHPETFGIEVGGPDAEPGDTASDFFVTFGMAG